MTASIIRNPEEDRKVIFGWMMGNEEAALFVQQFTFIAHLWDDLIDKDRERSAGDINLAFQMAMLDMQENPFYLKNLARLNPVMRCALNDWYIANELESGSDHDLEISYTLRCSILSVISYVAYLVGGTDWLKRVGPEIRRYGQEHTLEDYKRGLPCQT